MHNAFKCIKAAGETSYSASEYPMHYCYGYNYKNPQTAYGICIPSTCANDRSKVKLYNKKNINFYSKLFNKFKKKI